MAGQNNRTRPFPNNTNSQGTSNFFTVYLLCDVMKERTDDD